MCEVIDAAKNLHAALGAFVDALERGRGMVGVEVVGEACEAECRHMDAERLGGAMRYPIKL